MERISSTLRMPNDEHYHEESDSNFKCDECGREFPKPLLATVMSNMLVQKYYACPRCLTKVAEMKQQERETSRETSLPIREERKSAPKLDESTSCEHFLGYLKKRERDTPIPEDCLTCDKMIECMVY